MSDPVVVIHIRKDGSFDVLASGDQVRVIWVDEVGEVDVFEQNERVSPGVINRLIGHEAVGRPLAPRPGRPAPHLRIVPSEASA